MSPDKSNCPIFVTYHKADDIEGRIAYEDEFISPSRFKWMSRSNRRLESDELQRPSSNEQDMRNYADMCRIGFHVPRQHAGLLVGQ